MMRNTLILVLLAFTIGQLMSFSIQEPGSEINLYQVNVEEKIDLDKSVKYVSEVKTDQGTMLRATLDNGLEIVIHQLANTEVASVRAYVKIGSMYEGKNLGSGISHYCEHLVSGGSTKKRTEEESRELVASIGGITNAYTYFEETCYYITTLNNYAETAIDLIGDWLSGCIIKESEFNREKGVIITEVDKGETEPGRVFSKFVMSKMYENTPRSVPVIGYPALVKDVTRERMMEFYNKYYCPNNTVLSIAGGIDPQETLKQVVKYWGSWKRKPLEMPVINKVTEQTISKEFCLSTKLFKGNIAQMRILFNTVPSTNNDMFALDVLSEVLAGSENSRLPKLLKEEKHLANTVSSYSWTPYYGFGQFVISVDSTYDNLLEVRNLIFEELEELGTFSVQDEEIKRAKKKISGDYINYLQGADAYAKSNASDLMSNHGSNYNEKYLEEINKVTSEEIKAVINKYLLRRQSNVFAFYSKDAEDKDEDKNPFVKPEKPEEDEMVKEVSNDFITLDNGMRIILKKTPGTKNIAIAGYTHGGLRYENKDNNGIFRVLSMMMKRGSKKYDFNKISEIFSDIGGEMDISSGNNTFAVESKFVACEDNLVKALTVLNDVLRHPKFDEEELVKVNKNLNYAIQRKDESWEDEAINLMKNKFFGSHPYSMYVKGSSESLEKITIDQVKDLHSKYISPNNFVFAVVGDFDLSNANRIIRGIFNDWKKSDEKRDELSNFNMRKTKDKFVKKSSKKQVTICIGYNAPKFANREETLKITLLDAVTSGIWMPSGWLHESLRGGDRKYVYYVHAMTFFGQDAGMFYILTQCSVEDKDKVVEIIRDQMKRTWTEKISEKELDLAKRNFKVNKAIGMESNENKAFEYALDELYGIGWDNKQSEFDIIDKITADDLKEAAEKYFKDNELLVLIEPEKDK